MARICILLLTLGVAALGQTSADLSAKYSNVIVYRVRPHVLMTARFASDGQVCEMTLEKGQRTDTSIPYDDSFSNEEMHSLMDDLAPEGQRGRDLTGRFQGTIEGLVYTTVYTYENVLVHVYGTRQLGAGQVGTGGYKVIVITWRTRTCSGVQTVAR
jgi:hypothetical protein